MDVKTLTIEQKELLLKAAVNELKNEFVGIDGIIDEIADSILPWWLFPQHQLRPLIINLWGMTGSGKTELIKRLATLLSYNSMLMRFDMGEYGGSSSMLKWTLTRQLSQYSGTEPIILLDEFQFAKTKEESGKEVNNYNLRIIWDLLDSGEITYEPDGVNYYVQRSKRVMSLLEAIIKMGAKMKNGRLVTHAAETAKILDNFQWGYKEHMPDPNDPAAAVNPEDVFISDLFCTGLYEMNQNLHNSWQDAAERIKEFNSVKELYEYIYGIYETETSFKYMDLRKSLVFVVGNLDEAFVMSNNINPDIDADEFQRHTKKINIADIKSALQQRFRNEQIARLGNTHLIYHAFSHKNFEELIKIHLDKFAKLLKTRFKLKVRFAKAVNDLIYAEGVFPTQGVRPVISTIRNMIESNIARIILHHQVHCKNAEIVNWDFKDDHFVVDFFVKKDKVETIKIKVLQKINSLRVSTKNDLQALVAVHEAGHAIASMYKSGIVPEYIITKTVDTDSQGFTYTLFPEEIVTYRLLIDKIVVFLGGYVAEQMVYGKDLNTSGVSDDLRRVTSMSQEIIRDFGMHSLPAKFNIHEYGGNPYQLTFSAEMEDRSKEIINSCLAMTIECLEKNKEVFYELSRFLSENSRINKPEIIKMAQDVHKKLGMKPPKFVDKEGYYDFKKVLNKKYEMIRATDV